MRLDAEILSNYSKEIDKLEKALGEISDRKDRELAKIDRRRLTQAAQKEEEREITRRASEAAESHWRRLAELEEKVRAQSFHFTRNAMRWRARFHDDAAIDATVSLSWSQRLAKASIEELEYLARAKAGSTALIAAIDREVTSRNLTSDVRTGVDRAIAAATLSDDEERLLASYQTVASRLPLLSVTARELVSGRVDLGERMTAARASQTKAGGAGSAAAAPSVERTAPPAADPHARLTAARAANAPAAA